MGKGGWFVGFVLSVGFIEVGLDELVEVSLIRRKQMSLVNEEGNS